MFIIFLKPAATNAPENLSKSQVEAQKIWLKEGFDEGLFHMTGKSNEAGVHSATMILSLSDSQSALNDYIQTGPSIKDGSVNAEIIDVTVTEAVDDLKVLLADYMMVAH